MKNVIYVLLLLFISLSFQSCLHDDKDYFDGSASERIEKSVAADQQMLESSSNGWILNYYPGKGYSEGGYVYLLKFKNGKATVASEFGGPDTTITSDYAVAKDQGPVLTFNTYNPIMHWLAEASANNINTYQGDYEFIIDKVMTDSIVMTGKKWGNKMIMTRIPKNVNWSTYLDSIKSMSDSIINCPLKFMCGKDSVANVTIDPKTRMAKITTSNTSSSVSYTPTTKGVILCKPLSINNAAIQDLIWDGVNYKYIPTPMSNISLEYYRPADYQRITDIAGTYNLYYNGDDYKNSSSMDYITLTLTPNAKGTGLIAHDSDNIVIRILLLHIRKLGDICLF